MFEPWPSRAEAFRSLALVLTTKGSRYESVGGDPKKHSEEASAETGATKCELF